MVLVPWNVKWNKLKIKTQFNLHVFTKFYLKKKNLEKWRGFLNLIFELYRALTLFVLNRYRCLNYTSISFLSTIHEREIGEKKRLLERRIEKEKPSLWIGRPYKDSLKWIHEKLNSISWFKRYNVALNE